MIGRTGIAFLRDQIAKAEHRLEFQMTLVELLQFGSRSRYATLAADLLFLMEDHLADLHERHALYVTV